MPKDPKPLTPAQKREAEKMTDAAKKHGKDSEQAWEALKKFAKKK